MAVDRQAQNREDAVAGLRAGFETLYGNLVDAARGAGAGENAINQLERDGALVVGSIMDPFVGADGRYHLSLDTSRIDSELEGPIHWAYARLREAVESSEVIGLAVDREATRMVRPGESGITASLPRGSDSRRPVALSIVSQNSVLRGSVDVGRNIIHEIDLHAVPRLRGASPEVRSHQQRRRRSVDGRGAADLGDDFLRRFIPTSGEGPFGPAPDRNYNPDRRGLLRIGFDVLDANAAGRAP